MHDFIFIFRFPVICNALTTRSKNQLSEKFLDWTPLKYCMYVHVYTEVSAFSCFIKILFTQTGCSSLVCRRVYPFVWMKYNFVYSRYNQFEIRTIVYELCPYRPYSHAHLHHHSLLHNRVNKALPILFEPDWKCPLMP